jgi:hypothetical protein
MADWDDWEEATVQQRHLAVAADAELRRRAGSSGMLTITPELMSCTALVLHHGYSWACDCVHSHARQLIMDLTRCACWKAR